ncbi:MAG: hypothetical protein KF680_10070 [Cryobacterium sp.]|nr:hypothetical protein [Cryobacterium sp.]
MFGSTLMVTAFLVFAVGAAIAAIVATRWSKGEQGDIVVVTRFLAAIYAAISLVATVITVVTTLVSDVVRVTIPVQQFWPDVHPWVMLTPPPQASVVGGGISTADVDITGLGLDARLWLAGGHALQGMTFTLIALVVALLCHRMLAGSPFRATLARSIAIVAATIAAGGMAWQVCFGVGGSIASDQALTVSAWAADGVSSEAMNYLMEYFETTGLPQSAMLIDLGFWPLMLGLALAVIGLAFQHSARLQRDTEGLV